MAPGTLKLFVTKIDETWHTEVFKHADHENRCAKVISCGTCGQTATGTFQLFSPKSIKIGIQAFLVMLLTNIDVSDANRLTQVPKWLVATFNSEVFKYVDHEN